MRFMLVLLALLVACSLVVAGAGSAQPASARTFTLVAKPSSVTNMVRGTKAPRPGSSFLEYGMLSGSKHGTYAIQGVLAAPLSIGVEINTDTFVLPGGSLVAVGSHRTTDRFSLPLVGGTGVFAGVHGTLTVAPGTKGTERLTFSLL